MSPRKTSSRRTPRASGARRTKSVARQAGRARAASGAARAATTARDAIEAAIATGARTIVYVHGIGNKPRESVLKCQWDQALFGFELGERSRLAYWVNREYYPEPSDATCAMPDHTELEEMPTGRSLSVKQQLAATSFEDEAAAITDDPDEQRELVAIAEEMEAAAPERLRLRAADMGAAGVRSQALFFDWITRNITRAFLRDVHDFLFVDERRQDMRDRVRERLDVGGGPFIVIGHSQGSMIAYDVLSQLDPAECQVPLFVTLGSPLGLPQVKRRLREFAGQKELHVPACVGTWLNVADPTDPVAFDWDLRDDFRPKNAIVNPPKVRNPDAPRDPHSGSGYLRTSTVRVAVQQAVDRALFQRVAPFVIARNLARTLENARASKREPVLIQLVDMSAEASPLADTARTLDAARQDVVTEILGLAKLTEEADDLRLERLQRYVSANLTRRETERLAASARLGGGRLMIERIWRNERKRALLDQSVHTIHARAAHSSYGALGRGIVWAVLDSGLAAKHPHFTGIVEGLYDCTRRGTLKEGAADDENGHGTHVAGIIAGRHTARMKNGSDAEILGVAPETRLRIYKVLDAEGFGNDAWIIKALDHIAETNERAGALRIQGVNLSLGGPYDQSTFATGHTPLCNELRRLWRQGVLVVLAAGNEGFATILTEDGPFDANLDLTICDPANLEDAITVGSTHRARPHTYGVSYFSSRGPTADGRQKPDLVAPGERILSCRHDFVATGTSEHDLDVRLSGTSMAAPHVSGLLAAFLSSKQEFIGQPDRVKQLLLESCVDLGRDRSQQGAGLPNLMKLLMNT
jgi:pimeloyl-ACP methyl ester carboxylesterase